MKDPVQDNEVHRNETMFIVSLNLFLLFVVLPKQY